MPPSIPPRSLANNNLCIGPPPELQNLSLGEQLFIARGHALRRLRTLSHTGDPAARQTGLLGTTSAIAFPQDPVSILSSLPPTPESLCDYISVFFPTKPKRIYGTARNSSFAATSYMLLCAGYFITTLTIVTCTSMFRPCARCPKTQFHCHGWNMHKQPIFLSHENWDLRMPLPHLSEFRHSSCCAWQYYRRLWSSTLLANCFARLRPFPNSHSLPTGLASSRLSSCLHCVNQTGCKCRTSQLCTRYPISTFFPPFEWKDLLRTTTCRFAFE